MVSVPADSEKRRAIKRKEGESLDTPYAIEMLHITKRFPGIIANDDITLQVKKGEIHALLGENGAGKSTLMSVLFGLYQAEEGTIKKDGVEVSITYKAKKATTLLPASAVRNEGENSDYVYLIQRSYGGLLTSSSMKVVKTSVRVLERGEKLVSIEDDLSYQQVADKEDRELTDNQTVMEYVN